VSSSGTTAQQDGGEEDRVFFFFALFGAQALSASKRLACGKQAAQYAGKLPDEGSAVTSRDTAAAESEVHSSGHTHRQSMRLKEMSAAKQAGGKGGNRERQAACCAEEEDAQHEASCADATSFARR